MKQIEYELHDKIVEFFFPKERIKNKNQILQILFEATRYMLRTPSGQTKNHNKIVLFVDKMSRLFFYTKNKYYSIAFPFYVTENELGINFSYQDTLIDSSFIANAMSILKDKAFNSQSSIGFAEPIYLIEDEYDDNFWPLFRDLLIFEDGYLRYDDDIEGYKEAKAKGQEHRHPKNHLDIFYTNKATFKIGLDSGIDKKEFIDYVNINTDCKYLRNHK